MPAYLENLGEVWPEPLGCEGGRGLGLKVGQAGSEPTAAWEETGSQRVQLPASQALGNMVGKLETKKGPGLPKSWLAKSKGWASGCQRGLLFDSLEANRSELPAWVFLLFLCSSLS